MINHIRSEMRNEITYPYRCLCLGNNKEFHPAFYNGCNYYLGFKLSYDGKGALEISVNNMAALRRQAISNYYIGCERSRFPLI